MFESIVVGTDGSATAGAAVRTAADLAKLTGATLHLVNAYRVVTSDVYAAAAVAPTPAFRDDVTDTLRNDAEAMLQAAAEPLRAEGIAVETHVGPCPADEAILRVARDAKAGLVVVGSRGMTGARRILGSVPNRISHHADCAVMIVKTD